MRRTKTAILPAQLNNSGYIMADATILNFTSLPSSLPAFKKAVTAKKPGIKKGATIPRIEAVANNLKIDTDKLLKYGKVCGFGGGDRLPTSFLHIFAGPLHMAVMSSEKFPLKMIGLVHIRNVINHHRAVKTDEIVNVHVMVEGHREVDSGNEFDIISTVRVGNEIVWDSVSTMLSRGGSKGGKKKSPPAEAPTYERSVKLEIPSNTGRRYAGVSGDWNPIHLFDFTAKPLGFKSAIIHGMWTLARSAAEMEDMLPEKYSYSVEFKLPIFLPGNVLLKSTKTATGVDMRVTAKDGKKPHMVANFDFS
jgi:acyl dehydratase